MKMSLESAQEGVIDAAMCLTLLGTQQVGRLVSGGSKMRVRPVNYVVADNEICFRTGRVLPDGSHVVFEVDQIDSIERRGWSVIVEGHLMTPQVGQIAPPTLERLASWAPGAKASLMRIVIEEVTGRWVRAERTQPASDDRGYL